MPVGAAHSIRVIEIRKEVTTKTAVFRAFNTF